MNCPKCKSPISVTNSYEAGDSARTQRAVCDFCGTVCVVVSQIEVVDPARGHGAAAVASRIKKAAPGERGSFKRFWGLR